jgi:calcyclin binding protein
MVLETKSNSLSEEYKKVNPASEDADELEAILSQVHREGARVALKQAINKLRSTALKAKAYRTPAHTKHEVTLPAKLANTKPTTPHGEVEEWKSIDKFYYSDSGYNEPTITVYVDLLGVGASKDRVECNFSAQKFDLQIRNHNGVNYRMIKEPLEKDIVPKMCKTVVKKNQIKLKLRKKKGEYSYDSWTRLIAKGGKRKDIGDKDDPSKSLMSMMKDMYDEGDDATKKMIGEAMMKSRMGKVDPLDKEDKLGDDDL